MILKENWVVHIFFLYLMAQYELMRSNITAQTVTLGANLLVKAQTIPQNTKCVFLIPKVEFTKDIYIFNIAKGFEICFIFAILKYVKIPKTVKMCPP